MQETRSIFEGGDQIWNQSLVTYYCECIDSRVYRLTFCGGSSGNYLLECCQKCYDENDKKFLLKEEKIEVEEK